MEDALLFGLQKWGEFGQIRYQATLVTNEKRTIPLLVPAGRWWVIFKYRFGDITADTINFRFDNVRNYFEQNILIGTELLNFVVEPKPYIVASGHNGAIIVWNTSGQDADFSMVLDFYVLTDEIQGRLRELILADREDFRAMITKLASTGGA